MSVLVKNMEMPKNCDKCPVALSGKYCRINKTYTTYIKLPIRPDHCPLVEIPEHHGRLIDADELIDYCKDMIRIISESDDDMINIITSRICYASVIRQIINMTTIFETEGEG